LRRLLLLIGLALLLALAVWLNRQSAQWHYIMPVEAGKVAYLATFDAFPEDWNLAQGRLKSDILPEGVLRMDVGGVNSLPFAEAHPFFADFDARVQATPVGGPLNNGYGMIFRLQNKRNASPDDDDFYLFMVSSDGYYQVVRSVNGNSRELSTWVPSPAVVQGVGVMNTLRVVAKGAHFRFFVNGQAVQLCLPDEPTARSTYNERTGECLGGKMVDELVDDSIANGQIGVAAQTFDEMGVVVDFDNLVIYGPE
jgi:hypothetical protein